MNPLYQEALDGTLKTKTGTELRKAGFTNQTEIALDLSWIGWNGLHNGHDPKTGGMAPGFPPIRLNPGATFTFDISATNSYFLFTCAYSGAFMCVATSTASDHNTIITCDMLTDPNDIGRIPVPNQSVVIPPDSPRVRC